MTGSAFALMAAAWTALTAAAPDAPVILSAAPGSGRAVVTWSAPNDNGSPIIDYTATATSSGHPTGTCTVPDTDTSCPLTGLDNGALYSVVVKARNADGDSLDSAPASVTPVLLEITTPTSTPQQGTQQLTATGGSGGYSWAVTVKNSGSAADVDSSGLYTAGPTGGVNDTVRVTDSQGSTATALVPVSLFAISPASVTKPPGGSQSFTTSGGSGAVTWNFTTSPSAPASGGSINASTGAYTAGATGGVTDTVRATDSLGNVATAAVTVSAGVAITPLTPSVAPNGSTTFSASGGSGSGYTWSIIANGSGGATINSSTGAYTAGSTGGTTDTVRVVDSLNNAATTTVTVTGGVQIAPSTSSFPSRGGTTFTATGGSGGGYTWSITANGSLGTINASTGVYVAGNVGGVTDTIHVEDSLGNVADKVVTVTRLAITPATPSTTPLGTINFSASGGQAPLSWTIPINQSGANLSPLTGSPIAYHAGAVPSAVDTVRVTDALGNVANVNVSVGLGLAVNPASPSVAPRGTVQFSAAGGSGTGLVWSIQDNASGGTISASGLYAAGPKGEVTDTIKVTDSVGNSGTVGVQVGAELKVTIGSSRIHALDQVQLTVSGGSGQGYVWSIAEGGSGGTIDANGLYTAGRKAGTDTVTVTDSLSNTATVTLIVESTGQVSTGKGKDAGGCSAGPGGIAGLAAALLSLWTVRRRRA